MAYGRPSLGHRKQILVRFPLDLVEQIDKARGSRPMNSWLEDAARVSLRPSFQTLIPDLLEEVHHHRFVPSRTELKQRAIPGTGAGETYRVKYRKCLDCDVEEKV